YGESDGRSRRRGGQVEGDTVDDARDRVGCAADGNAIDDKRRVCAGDRFIENETGGVCGNGEVAGSAGGFADEREASAVGVMDDAGADAGVEIVDGGSESVECVVGGADRDGNRCADADLELERAGRESRAAGCDG